MEAVLEDPYILITDKKISIYELLPPSKRGPERRKAIIADVEGGHRHAGC